MIYDFSAEEVGQALREYAINHRDADPDGLKIVQVVRCDAHNDEYMATIFDSVADITVLEATKRGI